MLSRARLTLKSHFRQFSTAVRNHIEGDGDWFYSSEWWGHSTDSHTVFREVSENGNGVVSVIAHPSSKPDRVYWGRTEEWLKKRYAKMYPADSERDADFRILGYQWRSLHFNDETRQSVVKVMAAYRESDPGSIYLMQQANCLAVPYVKSMISAGLSTISCSNFDLKSAILGQKKMNILCIGHGGGSIPLFLASQIQGAEIDIVEIDPLVISASVKAMGFPSFSVMTSSKERAQHPNPIDEVLWKGIHERLLLHKIDAEEFILGDTNIYDMVFIDAYDGDDIFPSKLWVPHSPFLKALGNRLHPEHGTVVVNLHSDSVVDDDVANRSTLGVLPMGRYVSKVCKSYKNVLLGNGKVSGVTYTVSVPWVCNTSLVVSRCCEKKFNRLESDSILDALLSEALEVENVLKLPFSCFRYIKRGFTLVS